MSEALVKVENVSKKFCRDLKRSLWYGVRDIASELFGGKNGSVDKLREEEFWAVTDVSFEVKRGECLGLIGHNGAGKSTLLKMLNGLIKPDRGSISMKGRVAALIELGAGFNPILTGRENVYINGQILGFEKEEVDTKFDSIVNFSEIGDFINSPVQNYSSGMKMRLGFAIAAQLDPDVLIIDEVLAVGDVGFRAKCFNAINSISQKAAVIFVSHSMPQIARISTKGLLLNKGCVKYYGNDVPCLIDSYYSVFSDVEQEKSGSLRAEVVNCVLSCNSSSSADVDLFRIEYMEDLTVDIQFQADSEFKALNVTLVFYDKELKGVAQVYSVNGGFRIENSGERIDVRAKIRGLNLNPGVYSISVIITDERRGETLVNYQGLRVFQVFGEFIGFAPVQYSADWQRILN